MKMLQPWFSISIIIILLFSFSCANQPMDTADQTDTVDTKGAVEHPSWSRNAVIYEVNVRQFTSEGTFNGVYRHLTRLYNLGVDILWLMPIHPIGVKNRKGELGSYYSVKDYKAINPEFGDMDSFKALVDSIHSAGMHVIIDWVPNHSSWDNPLVEEHPDWYKRDSAGNFVSPYDWTDVIQFDYSNQELRDYMVNAMKFWIEETDIDGFRCDVAHMVPVDFWNKLRDELNASFDKEIFMLAESDQPELHNEAFDMTYGWRFHHLMNEIAQGNQSALAIDNYFDYVDSAFLPDAYIMQFTSNHDENSWNGTVFERLGDGVKTFAVLAGTVPDMLLIYNGQEVGMDKRLKFFEKDSIIWKDPEGFTEFYTALTNLKKTNKAIWNGEAGGEIRKVSTQHDEDVYAFYRESQGDLVFVVLNLSDKNLSISLDDEKLYGNYIETFTRLIAIFDENNNTIELEPWEYLVYVKK